MQAASAPASRRIPALPRGAALWQADQLAPAQPACPSGWAELDAELPGGGWPAAGLTELLHEPGSGEIRLLAPALARLGGDRELVWIAPPYPPYAPALHALGLPLARLLWLKPASAAAAAWAAEQVLRSGAAGAVLWWSREAAPATLRRLHLAAQAGGTPLFALRPWDVQRQASPAPLRIGIEPGSSRLLLHLLKRRGPSLGHPLSIALPQPASRRPAVPASTDDAVARAALALAVA